MKNLKVKDIMSTDLVVLEEREDLELAENAMRFGRIRHLPVVRDDQLVGLVTHRDLLRAQVSSLAELSPDEKATLKLSIPVREIMATDVKTVQPGTLVLDAARILKENKYGCLPVVEGQILVGIITEADFIDLVIRAIAGE
jgi:CBS domain-containing membrane protein